MGFNSGFKGLSCLKIVKLGRRACDFVFMGTLNKAAGNKNHSKHINESGVWKSTCKVNFTYVWVYKTQGHTCIGNSGRKMFTGHVLGILSFRNNPPSKF